MPYQGRSISQQLGEWPDVPPGQVKVTKLPDGDEAVFSLGRRRGTKHSVLSREEALNAWIGLGEAFGFTAKDKMRKRAA
jgi:hypothetical protein